MSMVYWLKIVSIGIIASVLALFVLDKLFPPPLYKADYVSPQMVDREGHWLHAFQNKDDNWRLPVNIDEIDPQFIERLVLIEDKRFYHHAGVDVVAVLRAMHSAVRSGQIVSGASTITMQTARLLEPRPRNLGSKIIEMMRALQIERRLTKKEILSLYLSMTPYGGNIQGVRSASLIWFGKEPHLLKPSEQALLIALPQSPEARRPDRKPNIALKTRNAILKKLAILGVLSAQLVQEAITEPVPSAKTYFERTAMHLSRELSQADFGSTTGGWINTPVNKSIQLATERLIRDYVVPFDDGATAAAIIVDHSTRDVIALVGSSGTDVPGGWIDLTKSLRSPGSTLKPFIYAMAFEDGILHADSVIDDMPRRFGSYTPENFDRTFRGEVRIREALQHSLNIPAVSALEEIGSARFSSALAMAGTQLKTPQRADNSPGLALALGGAGITMRDIASLYSALASDGSVRPLRYQRDKEKDAVSKKQGKSGKKYQLMSAQTAKTIADILRDAPSLAGRLPANLTQKAPRVAFKTGTSYGFRDAWSAGFDDLYTVVVWVGRADGSPRPGKTGRNTAAPLLFSIFDMLAEEVDYPIRDNSDNKDVKNLLPVIAQHRNRNKDLPPEIIFPVDGAELFASLAIVKNKRGIALTARGGHGEQHWYVDGQKLERETLGNRAIWYPQKEGFYQLAVVDEEGLTDSVTVRVRPE